MAQLIVAVAKLDDDFSRFPLRHGLLRASGSTIEGPRLRDWFEIFVDNRGNLNVLLLDVACTRETSVDFLAGLLRETHTALLAQDPLHHVVAGLELSLAAQPGLEAGLIILRVSERDAKVELLNAGMPAVASAGFGQPLTLYPALSGAVGRRVGEVHPYELLPLVWGVTWLATSAGMLAGGTQEEGVAELCRKLDLSGRGSALSAASTGHLYEELRNVLGRDRLPSRDATAVLVSLDPSAKAD